MTGPLCPQCGSTDVAGTDAGFLCNDCGHAGPAESFRLPAAASGAGRPAAGGWRPPTGAGTPVAPRRFASSGRRE